MSHVFWNRVHNDSSRSLILAPIETRKREYGLLLDLNSNQGHILLRFRDIRAFVREAAFSIPLSYSGQNFRLLPSSRFVMLGSAESEHPTLTVTVKLFSKNFNQYVYGTSTSRTDRRTTCRINTAQCYAERGIATASRPFVCPWRWGVNHKLLSKGILHRHISALSILAAYSWAYGSS